MSVVVEFMPNDEALKTKGPKACSSTSPTASVAMPVRRCSRQQPVAKLCRCRPVVDVGKADPTHHAVVYRDRPVEAVRFVPGSDPGLRQLRGDC